jgi:hypothetical protein
MMVQQKHCYSNFFWCFDNFYICDLHLWSTCQQQTAHNDAGIILNTALEQQSNFSSTYLSTKKNILVLAFSIFRTSIHGFPIVFWACSDSVVFLCFSFVCLGYFRLVYQLIIWTWIFVTIIRLTTVQLFINIFVNKEKQNIPFMAIKYPPYSLKLMCIIITM